AVGQYVNINNVGAGYNGTYPITSVSGSTFTYTDVNATGLAATTGGAVNPLPSISIVSATQVAATQVVTVVTSAPLGVVPGQPVTVQGMYIPGYNGSFIVSAVGVNSFSYFDPIGGLPNSIQAIGAVAGNAIETATTVNISSVTESGTDVTVTTATPHN